MLEPSRYSPALAVSDAWRRTNTEKLYEELWWGILYYRRWYRRLCHFISFKIIIDFYTSTLRYHRNVLFIIICIELMYIKPMLKAPIGSLAYFQNCMREWNQLDESIKSSPTASVFKRELMRLIRPPETSLFGFHDIEAIRLLARLRVEFSDLREHRFRHNFQCSSPMRFCQTGI